MLFRSGHILWLVLLSTVYKSLGVSFYWCYNDSNLPNIICLSTDTDSSMTWQEANTTCNNNGSTLIDVANETVQNILNQFRAETGSQLSGRGNWIGVHSVSPTTTRWIDGSSEPGGFDLLYQDSPPTRVFAAIRNGYSNNTPAYCAQTYDNSSSYICQFADTTGCVNGGGLIRNSTCYKKYTDTMTWFEASNACLQNGGSLAIFADLGKPYSDTKLTSWLNITETQSYWIGFVRRWWMRNGDTVIQYSNWNSPRSIGLSPQGTFPRAACVLIETSTNKWLVYDCSQQQRFVCQTIQPRPISTTSSTAVIPSSPTTPTVVSSASQSAAATTATTTATTGGSPVTASNIPLIIGVIAGVGGAVNIIVLVVNVLLILRWRKRTNDRQQTTGEAPAIECAYVDPTQLPDDQYSPLSNTNRTAPQVSDYEKLNEPTRS